MATPDPTRKKPATRKAKPAGNGLSTIASPQELQKQKRRLHSYMFKRLRSSHDAEDLVQDAFLKILKLDPEKLKKIKNLDAYVMTTAGNVFKDFLKKENRKPTSDVIEAKLQDEETEDSPEDLYGQLEDIREILGIARRVLTPHQYEIYILKARERLFDEEIAKKLKIGESAVRDHWSKIYARMSEALQIEVPSNEKDPDEEQFDEERFNE